MLGTVDFLYFQGGVCVCVCARARVCARACACVQLRPEGRNRRGETRLRGPEVLRAFRGLGIRPLVSAIRVPETPSQRPLRAPERLSGPRGRLFRGLGEVCPFSKERGKKVVCMRVRARARPRARPRACVCVRACVRVRACACACACACARARA